MTDMTTERTWFNLIMHKDEWGDGPWLTEPDKIQWTTNVGLPALIVRNFAGALCGYVGVGTDHPWHGVDAPPEQISVHGGLTFTGRDPVLTGAGVSFLDTINSGAPNTDEPDDSGDYWWFGFDTAHYGDLAPKMEAELAPIRISLGYDPEPRDTYRDVNYVRAEVERLAEQLAAVAYD